MWDFFGDRASPQDIRLDRGRAILKKFCISEGLRRCQFVMEILVKTGWVSSADVPTSSSLASGQTERTSMGMLKKAASGVLWLRTDTAALLTRSRTMSTLRASKGLRPCWTNPSERLRACFFEHSLSLMWVHFSGASTGSESELFNRPIVDRSMRTLPRMIVFLCLFFLLRSKLE